MNMQRQNLEFIDECPVVRNMDDPKGLFGLLAYIM